MDFDIFLLEFKGIAGGWMTEQLINIDRMEQAAALFGNFDENIRLIEN